MANLPYQPFPEEEGVSGAIPEQHPNVIPGAFGAGIAQAAGKFGDTLEKAGQEQFATAIKFQQLANETATNNANHSYADFITGKEVAFRQLQGTAAYDAFPAFQKDLEGEYQRTLGTLQSPMSKLAFQREARSFYDRTIYGASLYAGEEAKRANDESWKGAIETEIGQGALHPENTDAFNQSLAAVTDKALIYAHGTGQSKDAAEYTQQKAVGELVKRSIDTLLSKSDIEGAKKLFEQMQGQVLPDSGKPAMDPASTDAIGKAMRINGSRIYVEQDKAATAAINARVGLAIKNGQMSLADGLDQLTQSVNAGSDNLSISDPNQRSERISDAASNLGISIIEGIGATGTTMADDRAALKKQQAMYDRLRGMKLPGYPDQPLLNTHAQDSIAIRLHSEAETIERRSEVEGNKLAAQLRVPLMHRIENAAGMIDGGFAASDLPTDSETRAAFANNPAEAADKIEAVDEMRRISGFLSAFPKMTLGQMADLKAKVAPSPSRPQTFAQDTRISRALDAAINRTVTALKNDPAQYLITANGLHDMYSSAVEHPLMFGGYAAHIQAAQTAMGIPETAQHVLPAAAATAMANSISADPASAPSKMQQLQQQFGDSWPRVWRDISTLGKLPADYQLIGALDNRKDAELLSRAMAEGKQGKNLKDLLPETQATQITNAVRLDAKLRQYVLSLDGSGASDEQKIGIEDAVVKLAMAKWLYEGDANAAPDAIRSVVGNYRFMAGGARVPNRIYDGVNAMASSVLHGLDASKIAVPDAFGKPGAPEARDYLDSLKSNPTWITSPKGDAIWLKDNGGRIVMDKRGQPVAVPFNGVTPGATGWLQRGSAALLSTLTGQ